MGLMIRILFPLIGYLCIGTVITMGVGFGYLRQSGRLDDENMFRILSIVHGVDLEKIAESHESNIDDVPPEELSYEQQQRYQHIANLQVQAKKADLQDDLAEFDHRFKRLNVATSRYQTLRGEVEQYLLQELDRAADAGLLAVGEQLKGLDAKKQAKPLLLKMIQNDRVDDVILLINGMTTRRRSEILKTFDSEEDLAKLYLIQQRILAGDPIKPYIDNKIKDLQQLKQQDR